MCFGIALPIDALPEELVLQHQQRVAIREPGMCANCVFSSATRKRNSLPGMATSWPIYSWGNRDEQQVRACRIRGGVARRAWKRGVGGIFIQSRWTFPLPLASKKACGS